MPKKYENMGGESNESPKKSKFNLFSSIYSKDGKGVDKAELKVLESPGIKNYFKLFGRKFSEIFKINLMFLIGNFPVFFALIALAYTMRDVVGPDSQIYPMLNGSAYFDNSPVIVSLLGIFGRQDSIPIFSTATWVFFGLTALVLFTFGPVNIGTTYLFRNMLKGEPTFLLSDFFSAIKKNLRQGIIIGIIDILMIAMLVYDVITYRYNAGYSTMYMVMYTLSYGLSIFYFFIRMYPYLLAITFDMKLSKIIKNSIFFSILGLKRNIFALIACALVGVIDYFLFMYFLPLAVMIPLLIFFAFVQYTTVYCAYPKIKEIMIDPYYKKTRSPETETEKSSETEENSTPKKIYPKRVMCPRCGANTRIDENGNCTKCNAFIKEETAIIVNNSK